MSQGRHEAQRHWHVGLSHYLVVSAALFSLGVLGVLTRRNAVNVLMGIELILNSANLNLVAFSRYGPGGMSGQLFAVFVIVIAAAEVAVALAIVLTLYRLRRTSEPRRSGHPQGLSMDEILRSLPPVRTRADPDRRACSWWCWWTPRGIAAAERPQPAPDRRSACWPPSSPARRWPGPGRRAASSRACCTSTPWASSSRCCCCGASLLLLLSFTFQNSRELHGLGQGEFYALLLALTLSNLLLAASNDMVMLYLALEMVSITSYVMVAYMKGDRMSNEASLKYVLFGAVSTGAMLYGLSLLFGLTGATELPADPGGARRPASPTRTASRPTRSPCWSSRASPSRPRRCPSTSGAPTSTRARPPRSPRSCPWPPRPRASRSCCASSSRPLSRARCGGPCDLAGTLDWPAAAHGRVRPHHDRGQRGRPHPDQHEAAARLLLDRPRRLHHDGGGGPQRDGRARHHGLPRSPTSS